MSKDKSPYKSLRIFIVSLVLLALLACILPFFIKGPGNKKLISPDQIKLPEIKFLERKPKDTRSLPPDPGNATRIKLKKVYRWEDKNGVLHFSDYPNPDGPSELIMASPDNPSANEKGSSPKVLTGQKDKRPEENPPTIGFPMTLSPSQIKKLKQDAENIRKDLQDRFGEMEEMMDK